MTIRMEKDSDYPTLANAPITEALIDIQVRSRELLSKDTLQAVVSALSKEFPIQEMRHLASFRIDLESKEASSKMEDKPLGFVLRSEDRRYAVQIMPDRFSISRLTPYINWKDLRDKTEQFWSIYRDIVKPDRVSRLAVRYINRLLLPVPIKDFGYYFKKPIEVPEGLPQGIANYMTRVSIPEPDSKSVATVQQVLEGVSSDGEAVIIFDIDAFKVVDLDVDNDKEIWSDLVNLRHYKNRIFFESLTKNAIGLYK